MTTTILNAAALLLLSIGHVALMVGFVNRTHGLPLRHEILHRMRRLHDVAVPLFPPLLFWLLGWRGPHLLRGGAWHEVPWGWWLYLVPCMLGFVSLVNHTLRYQIASRPRRLIRQRREVFDVERELGEKPIGGGPHPRLSYVPFNETFEIESNEKTLHLPTLPHAWDGLRILHLSDWHWIGTPDRRFYERAVEIAGDIECDVIVFTGDLMDDMALLDWFETTLAKLSAPLGCYFILGNHDWCLEPDAIRQRFAASRWIDMAGRVTALERDGSRLALGGLEKPWMGQWPDWSEGAGAEFRLLLSHTPDNIGFAIRCGVDLMLSGHNHGGQVVLPVVGPVYSPSVYGCRYSGGLYDEGPTLVHVSRGLGAKHPLRVRCRPEITTLVLRRDRPRF